MEETKRASVFEESKDDGKALGKDSKRAMLFECVVKDDVKGFGKVCSDFFGVVFGRLPLLSLLYLYDARRIVKRYYADLIKERPREKTESIRAAEDRFRSAAGKCLRYFAEKEVSPLEMLAILGRGKQLKKLFSDYPGAARLVPSLHRIYFTRIGVGISVVGNRLVLPVEPLTYEQKRWRLRFALVFLSVGVVFAAVTAFLSVYFGLGNDFVYYKARTGADLLTAITQGQSVYLKKDVTLSGSTEYFDRQMEGNGHIVRLSEPFAEVFEGNMRNVIFVLEPDFEGDAVILENRGVLSNVRVVAEGLDLKKGGEYMGLLTAVNKGTVKGCYAVLSVQIKGDAGGDCFFAPFAGCNEGTVHNCHTDGVISAVNVDVAGVVGKNLKDGSVLDCVVSAELSESSDIKGWTPNVAGVADHNEGVVYGCVVQGVVASTLTSPALKDTESVTASLAAGIVCSNKNSVKKCVNKSAVKAESANGTAMAAGISCQNEGEISECEGVGSVQARLLGYEQDEKDRLLTVYAAGIACVNVGEIQSCTTQNEVNAEAKDGIAESGGIVGLNAMSSEDVEVKGTVEDCVSKANTTAYSSTHSAFAGGVVSSNSAATVLNDESLGEVSATSLAGGAFAGGIVAKNVAEQITAGIMLYTYSATVNRCAGKGAVRASSQSKNSHAGGVVGINDENCLVIACKHTASVAAESEGNLYDYTGGVVGRNNGSVRNSFFLGTLKEADADSLVGAICGLNRLQADMLGRYYVDLSGCAFLEGDLHATGAVVGENIYTYAYFEANAPAYLPLFDYGATAVESLEALKALEIYYD